MQLEMHAESGVLNVEATGRFSLKEAKRTFLEVLDAVARHGATRVLLDGRRLLGKPEALERFYYGVFAAKSVREYPGDSTVPATRFAYVLKEPVLDPKRLGETVAVNRGMNTKVFDNPEDASRWLGIAASGKP